MLANKSWPTTSRPTRSWSTYTCQEEAFPQHQNPKHEGPILIERWPLFLFGVPPRLNAITAASHWPDSQAPLVRPDLNYSTVSMLLQFPPDLASPGRFRGCCIHRQHKALPIKRRNVPTPCKPWTLLILIYMQVMRSSSKIALSGSV